MAIRIDASGDYARRTTALPNDTNFSILGWGYLVSDRSGVYRYFCTIENNTTNSSAYKLLGFTSGDAMEVASQIDATSFGSAPSNGQWFAWMLSCDASTLHGYWRPFGGTTTYTASCGSLAFSEAVLYLGNDSYDEWNNIRLANVIVYDAVLTQAEFEAQSYQYTPLRRTNIHAWWPMFGGATERLRDYSGNAKTLTAGGTLTDEGNAPLIWIPYASPTYVVSGGSSPQTVTLNAITIVSSAETLTIVPGAVSITIAELTLAGTIENLTIASVVSIMLNELTLASSIENISILAGAVAIVLNELTLAGSIEALTISAVVSISLSELTLASSVENLTILTGVVNIALNELTLASSVENITILTGVIILLNSLTLVGSVQALSVLAGAVSILLDELTLASSIENINVSVLTLVLLSSLTLNSSVESMAILPGAVSITLDELTLAGSVENITVTMSAIIKALFKGMYKGMYRGM